MSVVFAETESLGGTYGEAGKGQRLGGAELLATEMSGTRSASRITAKELF